MTDAHVPSAASVKLGRVEGELKVGSNARIQAEDGNLVVVTAGVEFYGNATVECDLQCKELRVDRAGRLKVAGDLTVEGAVDVSNSIHVQGTMKADSVDVGGHVRAHSVVCHKMRVGGTAEVDDLLQADTVDVGGKIEARGRLQVRDLQVGGKAEIGGGAVTGVIKVGGKFESLTKLEFGELQVYGVGELAAGSVGKRIVASGKLEAQGDLNCEQIEVNGVASVLGSCDGRRVEVKGKLHVSRSLSASERLDVHGVADVRDTFSGGELMVSGRFTALKAVSESSIDVHGSVETHDGLKAKTVTVRSGSRCSGPIVADTVEVGGSGPGATAYLWGQRLRIQAGTSQVEDVYASRLVLGPGSRAGKIFAQSVELGPGCDVSEVSYINELKLADHVTVARQVKKVEKLAEPPL